MARTVGIGNQDFATIIENNLFYVDKTSFIKEWWESFDNTTLITRPRRFGKTLTLSMLNYFFSVEYAGKGELFDGLSIWQYKEFRELQGTYPVIFLSFADIKENTFEKTYEKICQNLFDLYLRFEYILSNDRLRSSAEYYQEIKHSLLRAENTAYASSALQSLTTFLYTYYEKKVIILLDEYDTPLQEAYVYGYWDELVMFTRGLFNATFKTNPYLERALMTGITRVSKESIFSDLNHLKVVTTTTEKYMTAFGFTKEEVSAALAEYELTDKEDEVKRWYDGFTFGSVTDIYNPWSIINYLDSKRFSAYWANSSSNLLVSTLLQTGDISIKSHFQDLINEKTICCSLDEEIIYSQLDENENAIWSLLLASGYLKLTSMPCFEDEEPAYYLALTNFEVLRMMRGLIKGWFRKSSTNYNNFITALLNDDIAYMNTFLNEISVSIASNFDSGTKPSERAPEKFYHGLVLGLIVELSDRYHITSNRESGFGRYDVMMEPLEQSLPAYIFEFKVMNKTDGEQTLEDTADAALGQIENKAYATELISRGFSPKQIHKFGFAFQGKSVLIKRG